MKKLLFSVLIGLFIFGNSGDVLARGGSFSGGGGRSFSGGSRSFSSPSRSYSSPSRPSTPSAPSRSYSSSSSSSTPSSGSSSSWFGGGTKSSAPQTSVNADAARAMRQQQSQEKFSASASRKPATDYFKSNNPSSSQQRVRDLKRELNYQKMQNRDLRAQQRFGSYYGSPAPVMYHDSFNPWFWMWLMSQNNNTRAETIYHHKDEMDPERYKELLAKDAALEAKIKELEATGIKQDASYVPPELKDDKDLMYSNDVVKAAYDEKHSSGFPWFWTIVGVLFTGGIYFIFIKRWSNL